VDVRFTKWGGGRHWEFPVTVLGVDALGVWCGAPVGTRLERPDAAFTSQFGWVTLFPIGRPWAASYYDSPDQPIAVYVDVATPPVWDGSTVSMVDLDLDVIVTRDGDLLLDDEDEFAEHQVTLGYPPEIVALASESAEHLMAAAWDGGEPFGPTAAVWLARLRAMSA
jgi:uncharacterized ubiquitin-like protein YukD